MLPETAGLIFGNGQNSGLKRARHVAAIAFCLLATWGCGATMQSAASAHGLTLPSTLPSGRIGKAYSTVLSVRGGTAPYRFVLKGTLPAGLTLNTQTGNIFGIPTHAGTFELRISVTDRVRGAFGTRNYTIAVDTCAHCVTVEITPITATAVPGGKIQFSATVSNVSNPAVTWSASAGTISSNGLFTAPVDNKVETVTVSATSVAETSARARTAVAITSTSLTIVTAGLPAATNGVPYTASLTAAGGQPPYQWSLVSGSLPGNLLLNSGRGSLSGSTAKAGSFSFGVRVTDAAAHVAQQSLTLLVSTSSAGCGPPAYNCSRVDRLPLQEPAIVPDTGSLTGANTIVRDPDFGSRIVRITDSGTDPGAPQSARNFVSSASGSADENLWNVDSTLFVVQNTNAAAYPFTFDPASLQAARMYVSNYPASGGLRLSDAGTWSRVNPNVLYTYSRSEIYKYDFSDRINPPSPQAVFDFTSTPNCLPAGFNPTWQARGGISAEDAVFGAAYSNTGAQGTGIYAVAYRAGSGCSMLNTQTGQVTGDWGSSGTISITDRWRIHNVKLSKDGNWLIIAPQDCISSSCAKGPYFWQIGTSNVTSCGQGGRCGGHWTAGYSHWVNNDNSPIGDQRMRLFSDPTAIAELTPSFPLGLSAPLDQHQSWNNADPSDSLPFFSTTWSPTRPFPAPWYNEIIGVAADGSGTVWRFAHSFITGQSQRFSTKYGIGSVSQDGKFFLFSSDWMGTLGSESGAATCTIGKDCRGDVFVVDLN
jgi:hypothetical protein